ncbi:MAG: ComF family protein [Candidatus Sumerlaeia bacterium]
MKAVLDAVRRTGLAVLDLALPSLCLVCGRRVYPTQLSGAFICSKCEQLIEPIELPVCPVCGAAQTAPIGGRYCKRCPPRPLHFDMARAVVRYNEASAALVKAFKYERLTAIGHWIGNMMFLHARDYLPFAPDVVVHVPLHVSRRMRRGFNQAELIARRLCRLAGWRHEPQALVRVRPTPRQSFLSRAERERNVRDAFAVVHDELIEGRTVMLIDDVFTSGSSAGECARMLRLAGAARVIVYTFARA